MRTVFGSAIKPVELNRSNYSFNELKDEVRVKHDLRDFQLRYASPTLGDLFIQDNDSFKRVCIKLKCMIAVILMMKQVVKDAEIRGAHHIEIRIISHGIYL